MIQNTPDPRCTRPFRRACILSGCACAVLTLAAQGPAAAAKLAATRNLAWTRAYATPYAGPETPPRVPKMGQLNLDSRFAPMLKAAFPQRQWFWGGHGRFSPLFQVVQAFLGVPGRSWNLGASAWIDQNRYITIDGCVPHDCFDHGMLWIDTEPQGALVFVATGHVTTTPNTAATHLWLFSSKPFNFETLPAAFSSTLQRWQADALSGPYTTSVTLLTLVPPNGEMIDFTYDALLKRKQAGVSE